MTITRSWRVDQSLVKSIRALSLNPALTGGIHKGTAPEKTPYPFVLIRDVASPYVDDWSGRVIIAVRDILVISDNSVVAEELDQSIAEALDNAALSVTGQDHMVTIRTNDLAIDPEEDADRVRVYAAGATYEIWTQQNL